MAKKGRKPVSSEELERVITLLPASIVKELDAVAETEGLSRSALIRNMVMRFLRERES